MTEPLQFKYYDRTESGKYLDIRKFISDIQARPALWNRNYVVNKAFTEDTWDELSQLHQMPKAKLKSKWKGLRDNFRVEYKKIPRTENGDLTIPAALFESRWVFYKPLLFLCDHLRSRYFDQSFSLIEDSPITEDDDTNLDFNKFTDTLAKLPQLSPASFVTGNGSRSSVAIPSTSKMGGNSSMSDTPPPLVPVSIPTMKKQPQLKRVRVDNEDSESSNSRMVNMEELDDDYHFLMSLHPFMGQLPDAKKLKMRLRIQEVIMKELFNGNEDTL